VRDGGDEIGESKVAGGGVLPLNGRRPRETGLRVGKGGSGLDGAELLLRGGAIVSLMGSGVIERDSTEALRGTCGEDGASLLSSSSSTTDPVAGMRSSASSTHGERAMGLECGTWVADNLRFLGFDDEAAEELVVFLVLDKFNGVDSSSGLKSSSSSSS
jgi:hypothetical protein